MLYETGCPHPARRDTNTFGNAIVDYSLRNLIVGSAHMLVQQKVKTYEGYDKKNC